MVQPDSLRIVMYDKVRELVEDVLTPILRLGGWTVVDNGDEPGTFTPPAVSSPAPAGGIVIPQNQWAATNRSTSTTVAYWKGDPGATGQPPASQMGVNDLYWPQLA